jgi:hypothetical protein
MVEDRLDPREPFQAHDLFAVEPAVGPAELGMTGVGQLAQAVVEGHDDLLKK